MIKFAVPLPGCPCSLKDRISDSGSDGPGSIPSGGTRKARKRLRAFFVFWLNSSSNFTIIEDENDFLRISSSNCGFFEDECLFKYKAFT